VSEGQGKLSVPPGPQIGSNHVTDPEMDGQSRAIPPDQPMDEAFGFPVKSTTKLAMSADLDATHDGKCCVCLCMQHFQHSNPTLAIRY
jgi:hypothetical protein